MNTSVSNKLTSLVAGAEKETTVANMMEIVPGTYRVRSIEQKSVTSKTGSSIVGVNYTVQADFCSWESDDQEALHRVGTLAVMNDLKELCRPLEKFVGAAGYNREDTCFKVIHPKVPKAYGDSYNFSLEITGIIRLGIDTLPTRIDWEGQPIDDEFHTRSDQYAANTSALQLLEMHIEEIQDYISEEHRDEYQYALSKYKKQAKALRRNYDNGKSGYNLLNSMIECMSYEVNEQEMQALKGVEDVLTGVEAEALQKIKGSSYDYVYGQVERKRQVRDYLFELLEKDEIKPNVTNLKDAFMMATDNIDLTTRLLIKRMNEAVRLSKLCDSMTYSWGASKDVIYEWNSSMQLRMEWRMSEARKQISELKNKPSELIYDYLTTQTAVSKRRLALSVPKRGKVHMTYQDQSAVRFSVDRLTHKVDKAEIKEIKENEERKEMEEEEEEEPTAETATHVEDESEFYSDVEDDTDGLIPRKRRIGMELTTFPIVIEMREKIAKIKDVASALYVDTQTVEHMLK